MTRSYAFFVQVYNKHVHNPGEVYIFFIYVEDTD
jgi:hypothetical protein